MAASLMNPQTIGQGIAGGAAMGAVQPVSSAENDLSRAFNTLIGGAAGGTGQAVVNSLAKVAKPIADSMSDATKNAIQTLKNAGVPLDAAQASGSKALSYIKSALSDNAITAGGQADFAANQKAAYNSAIAKTMGEDASSITPEIIQKAKDRIGDVYNDVLGKVNINVSANDKANGMNSLVYNLSDIKNEASKVLTDPGQKQALSNQIDNILSAASNNGGQISGDQYKNIKKILDRYSMSNNPAASDLKYYAGQIQDSLNGALRLSAENSGQPELVQALKQADNQWGNMRKIEDIALKGQGDISPSLLYNSLTTKKNRNIFYGDNKDLANLAAAGKQILPDKNPNSGTAARILTSTALQNLGTGTAGGLIGYQQGGDTSSALMGMAGGVAAPLLAQKLLNNPAFAEYINTGIKSTPLQQIMQLGKQTGMGKIAPALSSAVVRGQQPTELKDIGK